MREELECVNKKIDSIRVMVVELKELGVFAIFY